jgi:endonuclease YncB( thermonuclease family)
MTVPPGPGPQSATLEWAALVFWRKRNEGFEWREYVRTTILLRRQERRRKIEDAKAAAVENVLKGGRKGLDAAAAGLGAAGSGATAAAGWIAKKARSHGARLVSLARSGTRRGAEQLYRVGARIRARSAPVLRRARTRAVSALEPILALLARNEVRVPLAFTCLVAAGGATVHAFGRSSHAEAAFAAAIALATGVLVLAPRLLGARRTDASEGSGKAGRTAYLDQVRNAAARLPLIGQWSALRVAASIAALVLVTYAALTLWTRSFPSLVSLPGIPVLSQPALEGTATAVSGDTLSVAGRHLRLAGIEAPVEAQECSKPRTKRWRCGVAAREALSRAVRGRRVACVITAQDGAGAVEGRCTIKGADVAEAQVRAGYAFASGGLFASYAGAEEEARSGQAGLWAGEAERPDAWRSRRWEEAKQSAPGSCPIKGQITSGKRVYLLPWSPAYERARINARRGERWFCSEEEAQSAGWTAERRS